MSPLHGLYPAFTLDLQVDVYPPFVFGEPAIVVPPEVPEPEDVLLRIATLTTLTESRGRIVLHLERETRMAGATSTETSVRLVQSKRTRIGGST